MAQRAHGHMQPILFLLTDMDQNEIVLNKIWVFIRLYWESKSVKALLAIFDKNSWVQIFTILPLHIFDVMVTLQR